MSVFSDARSYDRREQEKGEGTSTAEANGSFLKNIDSILSRLYQNTKEIQKQIAQLVRKQSKEF